MSTCRLKSNQCNSPFARWSDHPSPCRVGWLIWKTWPVSSKNTRMEPLSEPKETTSRFEKLLAALVAHGVDFAVVGGLAVIFNGYPRLTLDIDILVQRTPENIQRLLSCLAQWGEGWSRELKPEDFQDVEGSIRVIEDFELDIFTRMRGKVLDDFRPRLRYLEIGGGRVHYLSPEDLIFLKEDSWRQKDKLDVQALRAILESEGRPPHKSAPHHD